MFKPEDIPIFIENIENVEPVSMCKGITRRTLSTGQKLMFCLFEWETGVLLPEHSHHHEQAGYVISGKVEFTIGGRTILLGPGESYVIPSNVVHSGKSYEPTRVLDAFSPIRKEYLEIIGKDNQQMDIKIVQANLDDTSEILELQKIAYQKEAALYDDLNIPPLTQTLPEIQNEYKNAVFLKAIIIDRIIGSVRASLNSDTCMIGRLIVHPEYQRKGIGSLLMREIELQFSNAKRFELFTGTKSIDNIRLYQKLGYMEYRQKDLSPNVRIVFMEKQK